MGAGPMPLISRDSGPRAGAAKPPRLRPRFGRRARSGISPLEAAFWTVFWLFAAVVWVVIPF